jgi:intracellular sulfur oxidation DsrE/DsrF family protein
MSDRSFFILFFAFLFNVSAAEEPNAGPIIKDYGASFSVADRDVPLVEGHQYKVVFELTRYSEDTTVINRDLDRVARFLNAHAGAGVPRENMDIVVVVHGRTLISLLNDDAYQSRFGSDNPSLELVRQLADAGVSIYACGQSLGFRQWHRNELASPVKVGLSAMTLVNAFQAKGYTYQL